MNQNKDLFTTKLDLIPSRRPPLGWNGLASLRSGICCAVKSLGDFTGNDPLCCFFPLNGELEWARRKLLTPLLYSLKDQRSQSFTFAATFVIDKPLSFPERDKITNCCWKFIHREVTNERFMGNWPPVKTHKNRVGKNPRELITPPRGTPPNPSCLRRRWGIRFRQRHPKRRRSWPGSPASGHPTGPE